MTLLKLILFVVGFIAVERLCDKQTKGFRLPNIICSALADPKLETKALSPETEAQVATILDQPFTFLDNGGQCYAFVSADGKSVIKFFKQHRMRYWHWFNDLSVPNFLEMYRKKLLKKHAHHSSFLLFESCRIAYEEFPERTGLLYLHLNPTIHLQKKLTIYDPIGVRHQLDLDSTQFVLQKRAELSNKKIKRLIRAGQIEEAQKCIDSILDLIVERCQKGISDRDPKIRGNLGFIEDRAIEIDVGSYSKDDFLKRPYAYKAELFYKTQKFKRWLEQHHAPLAHYLSTQINQRLEINSQ